MSIIFQVYNKGEVMRVQSVCYQSESLANDLNVYYHDETFWLTLENMSRLFGCDTKRIYKTLKEVLQTGKLNEMKVNQHIEVTSKNGKKYPANFYNLDVIMAIGYRLNAKETTQFRIWSMYMIKHYLLQGVKIHKGMVANLKLKLSQMLASA